MRRKECQRQAAVSKEDLRVSSLKALRILLSLSWPVWSFDFGCFSEGRKEGVHHLLMRVGRGWKEWFPTSSAVSWWEGSTEIGYGACFSSVR